MELPLLLAAGLVAVLSVCMALWAGLRSARRSSRRRLLALPAPAEWGPVLRRNVPLYGRLPGPLKERLAGLMHAFLNEKRFEGSGGLEMTEEIRLTVAAQACILLLGWPEAELLGGAGRFFPQMRSIFVYPAAYVHDELEYRDGLLKEPSPQLGESWYRGPVVLASAMLAAGGTW